MNSSGNVTVDTYIDKYTVLIIQSLEDLIFFSTGKNNGVVLETINKFRR